MWTPTTRKQHIRKTSRYQTDVTDQEWEVIACHLPVVSAMGRPRAIRRRARSIAGLQCSATKVGLRGSIMP
jgi:transposase